MSKWQKLQFNIEINGVVLIKEDQAAIMDWPMERVIKIFPDIDGHIYNVKIQTKNGIISRHVSRFH